MKNEVTALWLMTPAAGECKVCYSLREDFASLWLIRFRSLRTETALAVVEIRDSQAQAGNVLCLAPNSNSLASFDNDCRMPTSVYLFLPTALHLTCDAPKPHIVSKESSVSNGNSIKVARRGAAQREKIHG